jgi:hypothetical protein
LVLWWPPELETPFGFPGKASENGKAPVHLALVHPGQTGPRCLPGPSSETIAPVAAGVGHAIKPIGHSSQRDTQRNSIERNATPNRDRSEITRRANPGGSGIRVPKPDIHSNPEEPRNPGRHPCCTCGSPLEPPFPSRSLAESPKQQSTP